MTTRTANVQSRMKCFPLSNQNPLKILAIHLTASIFSSSVQHATIVILGRIC